MTRQDLEERLRFLNEEIESLRIERDKVRMKLARMGIKEKDLTK